MVAYSFQKRFAPLIREGLKLQTIRAVNGKRHAVAGDRLQLFTGMRTAQCARICPDVVCTMVLPCGIDFASGEIVRVTVGGVRVRDLDAFAIQDGFEDRADMSAFWREHHGARPFRGVVIEWTMPRTEIGRAV